MSRSTQYEVEVQERKDRLYELLMAWQRREGKSRAEFAEKLSIATGQNVTETMVRNWLERGALQRQMPATMEPYWYAITRPLPAMEHEAAMREINAVEYYESRRQA